MSCQIHLLVKFICLNNEHMLIQISNQSCILKLTKLVQLSNKNMYDTFQTRLNEKKKERKRKKRT